MILIIDTSSSKIRLCDGARRLEIEPGSQAADLPALARDFLGGDRPTAIGVVTGPGSFTGLRLGIAFAKGLALGWGVPLAGISVFDLAAAAYGGKRVLAIASGRGDYFVRGADGGHSIEKGPPPNAVLIDDYDLAPGVDIVAARQSDSAPVIPLYIRPSYADHAPAPRAKAS